MLFTLKIIHKNFIWEGKRPKIKHSTLINDYPDGGLKDIDNESKFKALHMSWLTRFHSDNTHPWMHIPKNLFF